MADQKWGASMVRAGLVLLVIGLAGVAREVFELVSWGFGIHPEERLWGLPVVIGIGLVVAGRRRARLGRVGPPSVAGRYTAAGATIFVVGALILRWQYGPTGSSPVMTAFGWALVVAAAAAAILAWRHHHSISQQPDGQRGLDERLAELVRLHQSGGLTDDEFALAKKRLLDV